MEKLAIRENYVVKNSGFLYDIKLLEKVENREQRVTDVLISSHGVQTALKVDKDVDVYELVENYIIKTLSQSKVLKENGERNFQS
ncbi:hypothetical protein [Mammaliicoccus sciuri]|uniref:hypothetical protein n=1 Tax=Mammaliicoccus sciuri TaxID=1296 RepID=UPI003F57F968